MKKSNNKERKRKIDTPFGWTQVTKKDRNGNDVQVWRCPHTYLNTFTNKKERSSYTCRKDRTILKHRHVYKIQNEDDELLDENDKLKNSKNTNQEYINSLEEVTASFVGSASISASVACSEQYRELICQIANLSISYFLSNKHIIRQPSTIIPKFNKNSMKDSILREGDKAFNQMLKKLQKFKFVNLMIDASTVGNMRVVHSTLSNPYSGLAPLPFRSTEKEGKDWGITEYKEEIENSLSFIDYINSINMEEFHIKIVSICHDQLPSQSVAISKVLSDLKQNDSILPIINVSCLNHLINNAFLHTIKNCDELKNFIPQIEEVVSIFRKRDAVEYIGRKIPNAPKTRWIYLIDTLSFIVKYVDDINDYLIEIWKDSHPQSEEQTNEEYDNQANEESRISNKFLELFLILLPLQKASLCFESEQSRLSDVIPVILTLLESYKTICSLSIIDENWSLIILHELLCQFFSRIEVFLPEETWAAWTLTRQGRIHIRSVNAPPGLTDGDICDYIDEKYSLNEASFNMEKEINDIIDFNFSSIRKEDEQFGYEEEVLDNQSETIDTEDEFNIQDQDEDERYKIAINDESHKNTQFKATLSNWRKKSLDEILEYNITSNTYDKAIKIVKCYYKKINSKCEENDANYYFDQWLFNNDQIFSIVDMNQSTDFLVWQNIYKHDDLRTISLVALMLLSIGTSESDVERLISMHRYIIHDRMTNLSPEVLLARLRLRAKAISDNYSKQ